MTDLDALLAEFAAAPKSGPMYDDVTAEQAAKRYNNKELALFHYYNPNGIMAEWAALSDRLIAFGRGYAAYGDFGTYSKALHKLTDYKRQRVGTIELTVALRCIRGTIDRGNAFLANNEGNA